MKKNDDHYVEFNEAVEIIMRRTGKNRRQARASLVAMCRRGQISAWMYNLNDPDEEHRKIPREWFPQEH